MDQSLLTVKAIITPVLKPVIVKDKILFVLRVNVTVIFNPRLFHNLHLISKSLLWTNCCHTIKVNITLVYKPRLFYSFSFYSILLNYVKQTTTSVLCFQRMLNKTQITHNGF